MTWPLWLERAADEVADAGPPVCVDMVEVADVGEDEVVELEMWSVMVLMLAGEGDSEDVGVPVVVVTVESSDSIVQVRKSKRIPDLELFAALTTRVCSVFFKPSIPQTSC